MTPLLSFLVGLATVATVYALLALALDVQFGHTGLLNFGHVAFFGVGAFASAIVTLPPPGSAAYLDAGASYQVGLGLPVPAGMLAAMVAGGLLAAGVGALGLRLSSHYLAVATFALAEIVHAVLANEIWLTRGQFGITNVPQPGKGTLVPVEFYPLATLAVVAAVTGLAWALLGRATDAPFGRALRAVRDDELAARSLGRAAFGLKLRAFVLGGVLAGLAGSLFTHALGVVHVEQFVPLVTFQVWLAVLLGGAGRHLGVVAGAFVFIALREGTRFLDAVPGLEALARANPSFVPSLRYVLIGSMLILVVRFFPSGLLPERTRRVPEERP